MIDKNFYLENLSAFDILIEDDRPKAEAVIFRIYSILQRDKVWLREVAAEEDITEEDMQLLKEVDEELQELDKTYNFGFAAFHQRVLHELAKGQSADTVSLPEISEQSSLNELDDDIIFAGGEDYTSEDDEYFFAESEFADDDDDDDDDLLSAEDDPFSHLSDEELHLVTDFIVQSARTKFDFAAFMKNFPGVEETFVEEEFLLPLISGKAFSQDDTEIAESLYGAFRNLGLNLRLPDLIKIIEENGKKFGAEILAFQVAIDSLQQGAHPNAVVSQLSQLLGK
ncbi:hypothetical protein [Kaistella palustris]|uniref:hypothetical protein n=1 Tax=Kaistella palustris TaxID=493376 RepID=UPI00041FF1D6|nr:hypothetical protein [Kaistella palustris]